MGWGLMAASSSSSSSSFLLQRYLVCCIVKAVTRGNRIRRMSFVEGVGLVLDGTRMVGHRMGFGGGLRTERL